MKTRADWPVAFFDDDYLKIYFHQFTPERTAAEADFIQSSLALPPGAAVLDLACGSGRHAVAMAKRGYRVMGVDFNPHYLAIAAEEAIRAGAVVEWVPLDMRALDYAERFDGVYSFFTSFGYFSDDENEMVLDRIARALRPGGRLLLDMANRDWVVTHPQERTWTQREDGALLMEEVTIDLGSSRVISRLTLIEPQGPRLDKEFDLRVYTCAELTALLRRYGMGVREVWGDADRGAYSTESRRLVLLAEKGAAAVGAGTHAG